MLDVIHTLYEDDVVAKWAHEDVTESEVKSEVRTTLYSLLYNRDYPYKFTGSRRDGRASPENQFEDGDLPPENRPVKPYIPPTDPQDLPSILDAPMG